MFQDEVIQAFCEKHDCQWDKIKDNIAEVEAEAIRGDLKKVSGKLYNLLKNTLGRDESPGNDVFRFMATTLAPLITEDMDVYKRVESVLFKKNSPT